MKTQVTVRFIPFGDACRALGISLKKGYELRRLGTFPVRVERIGGVYKVPLAELDRFAGIEDRAS